MKQDQIPYLRTHSYFSLLESLLSPAYIVNKAVEYEIPVVGMTDHRYLSGAVYFYETCKSAGIKPIIGLEVDVCFHGYCGLMTLLAANQTGWANLSALSSHLLINDQSIPMSVLKSHHKGLICISGASKGILRELILNSPPAAGLPDQFLDEIQSIFHTGSYIEIQRFSNGPLKNETQLLKLAADHTIPIIATQDIHYLDPSDEQKYRTLIAIKHNASIHALSQQHLSPGKLHFPSPADFAFRFKDIPQAIENLCGLVAQCNLELPLGETHFPAFPTPEKQTQTEFLRSKAYAGAKKHYGKLTDAITERLEYELSIIAEMGYEPIFLIVEDVINHARKLGIPTSSRGSAASSLVAHCLDITSP
ncbi:MAG: PHP domain-containing protein, partial [Anaerolineales bacterium]|nr:PHP domain-containing protein [Anaerolineales bacterium]